MDSKGTSNSQGPGAGSMNNGGPAEPVRHGEFCCCIYCLV